MLTGGILSIKCQPSEDCEMIREFSQNIDDDIGSMLFFFSREASDECMGN